MGQGRPDPTPCLILVLGVLAVLAAPVVLVLWALAS